MAFTKHDQGKERFDLIDPHFHLELAKAMTHGAAKYGDDNWKLAPLPEAERRYSAALERHFNAWKRGETIDADSGLPHLACATACLMMLRWFERNEEQLWGEAKKEEAYSLSQTPSASQE